MLEYVALAMLLLSVTALLYLLVFLHDLPHRIAKRRGHPQTEAIHYACWLSLFTLHAIWPLVFLWAVSSPQAVRVAVDDAAQPVNNNMVKEIEKLRSRLAVLEASVQRSTATTKSEARDA
ncbi:MAG: DUF3302 domain-containing protein [Planctomycetota bacterium]